MSGQHTSDIMINMINTDCSDVFAINMPAATSIGDATINNASQGITWNAQNSNWGYQAYNIAGAYTPAYTLSTSIPNHWSETSDPLYFENLIKNKDYVMLTLIADNALRIDRKIFYKLEKTIIESKDFAIISNYIRSTKCIDVKHLTKHLLAAHDDLEVPQKFIFLLSFMTDCAHKVNIKDFINKAIKNKNAGYLEWILISKYPSIDVDVEILKENNFKKIEKIFLKSSKPSLVYQFAKSFKESNRKKLFSRLRKLGDKEYIRLFVNEIDEGWVKALQNMK